MLENLLDNAGQYVHTNPWLALVVVFLGGAMTASNPCVLAMIPLMMSFVAGTDGERTGSARAFGLSLVFVAGLAATFTFLGMSAALAGKVYGDVSGIWRWVIAAVCLVMGLHLMEILRFGAILPADRLPRMKGWLGALVLGLLFGFVSAPCAAPILVVLLTYVAGTDASLVYGGSLLLVYALGHSLLILIAGTSMGAARKLIQSRGWARTGLAIRRVAGIVVILVGVYFLLHS